MLESTTVVSLLLWALTVIPAHIISRLPIQYASAISPEPKNSSIVMRHQRRR